MDKDEYTITLDTGSSGTITWDTSSMSDITLTSTDNLTIDISDYVTIEGDTINLEDIVFNIDNPVEFEDCMPDVSKIEDMCNDYPALQQAYEKFKTIYAMVHQDWVGRQKEDV